MKNKIQTMGSWNEETDYTFSICFNDNHLMTLEGLSEEDMFEIASCALVLLPEDKYQTLLKSEENHGSI